MSGTILKALSSYLMTCDEVSGRLESFVDANCATFVLTEEETSNPDSLMDQKVEWTALHSRANIFLFFSGRFFFLGKENYGEKSQKKSKSSSTAEVVRLRDEVRAVIALVDVAGVPGHLVVRQRLAWEAVHLYLPRCRERDNTQSVHMTHRCDVECAICQYTCACHHPLLSCSSVQGALLGDDPRRVALLVENTHLGIPHAEIAAGDPRGCYVGHVGFLVRYHEVGTMRGMGSASGGAGVRKSVAATTHTRRRIGRRQRGVGT